MNQALKTLEVGKEGRIYNFWSCAWLLSESSVFANMLTDLHRQVKTNNFID